RLILVAPLAALGAGSIAMGAVAYTSTRARRRLYLSQGRPGAAGDEGNPANGTGRGPRDPHGVGLPGCRSRGDRGANLPQPDRGARIHDVLRTQALPRRGGCSEGKRLPRRDRDRRGAFHPPEPVLLRRE